MAENTGTRAEMRLLGFGIKDSKKRISLSATLAGDLDVDSGQWAHTKGCPFASVEVLDSDDGVVWEFQRPTVTVGESATVQLRWSWPKRLPPDPKEASKILEARKASFKSTLDTLIAIFCAGMAGEDVSVRIFEEEKPQQDQLPFGQKAKEIVKEAIEQLRPKPGSGVESVTISSGGRSVTLDSDGGTRHAGFKADR